MLFTFKHLLKFENPAGHKPFLTNPMVEVSLLFLLGNHYIGNDGLGGSIDYSEPFDNFSLIIAFLC
jgi:hypothetical protein